MKFTVRKAEKKRARLRMALIGVSGSGKTYSALSIGTNLGQRVVVIDTERGSASKYAGDFQFDVIDDLPDFAPATYVEAIRALEDDYDVIIIDSLSHAWMGKGGALEQVDRAAKRSQSGNSFAAWRDVTPQHNALIEAMLQCKCHVIATMRAKTEYVMDKDERSGKTTPRKIGLAPVQRDQMEFEFDVTANIDTEHNLIIDKTRCAALDGQVIPKAGEQVAKILKAWLSDGAEPAPVKQVEPARPEPEPPAVDPAYQTARQEVISDMRDVYLSQEGKTEDGWKAYEAKNLKSKTADELETQLAEWQKAAAAKAEAAAPVQEAETVSV